MRILIPLLLLLLATLSLCHAPDQAHDTEAVTAESSTPIQNVSTTAAPVTLTDRPLVFPTRPYRPTTPANRNSTSVSVTSSGKTTLKTTKKKKKKKPARFGAVPIAIVFAILAFVVIGVIVFIFMMRGGKAKQ